MIIILLFSFALCRKNICICNFECSFQCPADKLVIPSSNVQYLEDYLKTQFEKDKEIELDLYSPNDKFTFEINSTHFQYQKLSLKVISNSKPIRIKIKEQDQPSNQIIEVKPNFQIDFPNLIPFISTSNNYRKIILNDPDPTPIPISVGMNQMSISGFTCEEASCSIDDLDSESAYQCGKRCYTFKSTPSSLEYTFKGVKFAVFGTISETHGKFNIYVDEGNPIEIDQKGTRRMFVQLHMSDELEYGEHSIKINGTEIYELYKIVYWPSMRAYRINSTELTKSDGSNWVAESDKIGGVREYSNYAGDEASKTIRCSKIWVYGSTASSHGNITIKFNTDQVDISEYSETRIDGVLLYESSQLDFDSYSLTITNKDRACLVYCIYYLYNPPPQTIAPYPSGTPLPTPTPTPIPISVGLAQMTTTGSFQCTPSYFSIDNINNLGCSPTDLESSSQCGYRCWTSSADFEYTFVGVKFGVYGTNDPQHGSYDIVIDGDTTITINQHKNTREMYQLQYLSDELAYGKHHVKIQNKGETYELYKIAYWPYYNAIRLNSTSFTKDGEWLIQSDGIGGASEYINYGFGSATATISCSKIWVYGSYTPYSDNMIIDFAGTQTTIDLYSDTQNDGSLLFESSNVYYDDHKLTVSSNGGSITLYCVYYIQDPIQSATPEPTPTISSTPKPSNTPYPTFTLTQSPEPQPYSEQIPISVGLTQMNLFGNIYCNIAYFDKNNIQNLGCSTTELDSESAYKCGYKCWSYGDANLSYTFIGEQFAIYGTFDPFHQKFNLTIDNNPPIVVDEYNEGRIEYTLIYMSEILEYKEHTIKIIGRDEIYEIYKLVYWPKINAIRVNSTQLRKTAGWVAESDGIGGVREYCNFANRKASVSLLCNRFWVYSSTNIDHKSMMLTFSGQMHTIDLYSESRYDAKLVFDSGELPLENRSIVFTTLGVSMLYCIYYINDPPPPTFTPYPTRTPYPESSTTYIDKTFIDYILTDQIEVTQDSPIDQISGCQFINIVENIDFLIRLEKEIPFFDNTFDYNASQPYYQTLLNCQYNGKLKITNCTFINSRRHTKDEGNVFSCHSDYSIDLTFESCNFINCGSWTNQHIIKILNQNSSLNMTNCTITFDNETIASGVFDFYGSYANIDNCTFDKCGTVSFNSQSSNGTFIFTNNIVTSVRQQFINITDIYTSPIISENIFKDNLVTNRTFISIIQHDQEIEFKNNTFDNFTAEKFDVFGGGTGIVVQNIDCLMTYIIFDQCYFINNINNRSIGSAYSNGGAFQIGYSSTTSNSSIEFNNCEFIENNCINGKGGALAINIYDDIVISNCTFENNEADQEGSAIYVLGKKTSQINDPLLQINQILIKNCQFIGNQGNKGSAIYLNEDDININTFEIDSCTFIDNACNDSQTFAIQSSSTKANFINNTFKYSEESDKIRSLLFNYRESSELTLSTFINCQATSDSIILLNGETDNSLSNVSSCTFNDCISSKYSLSITKGKSYVYDCIFKFSDNTNACSGLEINSPNTVNVKNCEFHSNNNKILNSGSFYIHNKEDTTLDKINIDKILFNNCIGSSFRTLSIEHNKINEDVVQINKLQIYNITSGSSIYGININKDVSFSEFVFENNQFSNELGGGYGSYLIPPQHITFDQSLWKNNYCSDNGGAFGGVIYCIDTLLLLKSVTFNSCKFTSNSALGNGGALYMAMASDTSIITISKCIFEVNKASGDCGAIFIESKDTINIESCSFVNNSAFKSLSINDPTDTLYIHGNGNVFLRYTNFSKGTYPNEQSNFQFSHVNSYLNENADFSITISYCMFSIVNPNVNQLFAQEVSNIGRFIISYSSFTHFITQNSNQGEENLLLLEIENQEYNDFQQLLQQNKHDDYNHLFSDLNAPVTVIECCFDNDEYIIRTQNRGAKILDSSFQNNAIKSECLYPEIIDEIIAEIESYMPVSPTINKNNKAKIRNIIIGCVVGGVCIIAAIVAFVLIYISKKKKREMELQEEEEEEEETAKVEKKIEFDSDQEIEMTQETNDNLYSKYSAFSYLSSILATQESSASNRKKLNHLPSSESTSSDFEESRWDHSYI